MRRVRGSGRSSRQTGSALGATGLQHGAARAGAHTRTEPVFAGSAAVVGLIGTLHDALRTLLDAESRTVRGTNDAVQLHRLTCQGYGHTGTRANQWGQTTTM